VLSLSGAAFTQRIFVNSEARMGENSRLAHLSLGHTSWMVMPSDALNSNQDCLPHL
jgi:hypothetical protein